MNMDKIYHPFYKNIHMRVNEGSSIFSVIKSFLDVCEINNIPENIVNNKYAEFKKYLINNIIPDYEQFYKNKNLNNMYPINTMIANMQIIFKIIESGEIINIWEVN